MTSLPVTCLLAVWFSGITIVAYYFDLLCRFRSVNVITVCFRFTTLGWSNMTDCFIFSGINCDFRAERALLSSFSVVISMCNIVLAAIRRQLASLHRQPCLRLQEEDHPGLTDRSHWWGTPPVLLWTLLQNYLGLDWGTLSSPLFPHWCQWAILT